MSGGHYNYMYFKIDDLAEQIKEDIVDLKDSGSPELLEKMQEFALELKDVARRAKDLEWFMSGDYIADDFIESMKKSRP